MFGQIDDREMLGELVLSSSSEHLRKVISILNIATTFVRVIVNISCLDKIVLFPIRGICGGGLRSLVRAAKEKNICLNIGIGKNLSFVYKDDVNIFVPGNQRPVKTETNRRTATDEFTLVSDNTQVIVEYIKF